MIESTMKTVVPVGITARYISLANFSPSPASSAEIVGIVTTTVLLASFLCVMLFTGLRVLFLTWYASYFQIEPTSDVEKEARQAICKWALGFLGLSLAPCNDGEQGGIPAVADLCDLAKSSSSCMPQMRITRRHNILPNRNYYTQLPPRSKLLSRKPLFAPTASALFGSLRRGNNTRRADVTLEMEEGLFSGQDAAAAPTPPSTPYDIDVENDTHFTRARESSLYCTYSGRGMTREGQFPGRGSFLQVRTTSL
ncbi:hypothetical protein F4808DRAFT_305662 [Astrocystis sublimbata]|nr:hypothetical protein F4808DRAFT_305662 [Astrocystis sublimbata]